MVDNADQGIQFLQRLVQSQWPAERRSTSAFGLIGDALARVQTRASLELAERVGVERGGREEKSPAGHATAVGASVSAGSMPA